MFGSCWFLLKQVLVCKFVAERCKYGFAREYRWFGGSRCGLPRLPRMGSGPRSRTKSPRLELHFKPNILDNVWGLQVPPTQAKIQPPVRPAPRSTILRCRLQQEELGSLRLRLQLPPRIWDEPGEKMSDLVIYTTTRKYCSCAFTHLTFLIIQRETTVPEAH